jgi:hypothetical protein
MGASVPGASWQGEGADAAIASFENISQVLSQLSDQIQHNGQQAILNRTFLQVLEFTGELAAAMAVLDILLVIASCVIVVATGGVAAPAAILIDGGLLALEMDILLAILAADALAWLIGTLMIYAINHPISLGGGTPTTSTTTSTSTGVSSGKLFSIMKTTPDGRLIRVRKLSPREVKKLKDRYGETFEEIKQKSYEPTDVIYVDQNGEYWIGDDRSDNVEKFP